MGVGILYTLLAMDSILFTVLLLRLVHTVHRLQPVIPKTPLAIESDLPSVTVCIPARNEEAMLAECLQRVINSTYQKLEIIVLDDSSSDNTSVLIKSFAHAGVRFVRGAALPSGWLGKNHALKELADEASGSYVFFMDVDTRISPMAIEYMVRTMLAKGVDMVSAIPRRNDPATANVVLSPLRYFWELLRHRLSSPAVAGNAWLIRRSVAQDFFSDATSSLRSEVLPEGYIARRLKSEYACIISTPHLGISTEKSWSAQCTTSTRLLYPMLAQRPVNVMASTAVLLTAVLPLGTILSLLFVAASWLHLLAIVAATLAGVLYTYYARTFWRSGWRMAFFVWPVIVLQEAALLLRSMYLYSRGRIVWKGRPLMATKQR